MYHNKKEKYSYKDFTIQTLNQISVQERIIEFQKYIDQLKDNDHEVYWTEAHSNLEYLELVNALCFIRQTSGLI